MLLAFSALKDLKRAYKKCRHDPIIHRRGRCLVTDMRFGTIMLITKAMFRSCVLQ
jgi:hypothetical protein